MAATEEVAHGHLQGQVAGQAMHAERTGNEPSARLRERELGVVSRNDYVARKGYLQAAAEGEPVHPGNDRLLALKPVCEPTSTSRGAIRSVAASTGAILQVPAGTEGAVAFTRKDADTKASVGKEVVPDRSELEVGLGVERIHHLWACDGDVGNRATLLVLAELEFELTHGGGQAPGWR